MRVVRFSPDVASDLDRAVAWYDRQEQGLGNRFLAEFRETIGRIAAVGSALRKVHGEFRHLKFVGFPYFVYFREVGQDLHVSLVISAARDPALIRQLLRERRAI